MDEAKGQGGPATPQPNNEPAGARWLIWSREHTAFWRPLRVGYTVHLDEAGRYDTAAALAITKAKRGTRPGELAPELMVLAPECTPASVLMDSLPEGTKLALAAFLASTHTADGLGQLGCSHGALDLMHLVAMLLEDVALMLHRPGSWEGANMAQVMTSHGYDRWQHDLACAAAHQQHWGGDSPYTKSR